MKSRNNKKNLRRTKNNNKLLRENKHDYYNISN